MLDTLLSPLAVFLSAILCVPTTVYAIECLAGSLPLKSRRSVQARQRPDLVVLVPAHNEEDGVVETVSGIVAQLRERDRLLVVADNCTDRTAVLARAAGAEVIERHDDVRRGKGFALDAGIRHLEAAPPAIVIVIDADCNLGANVLERLADAVVASGKPVQACNLMKAPSGAKLDLAVATFAFLVKNQVRPVGLSRLGLPCQLTGTGMAFPWNVLKDADLAHAGLVEDMKLGLDLARVGYAPHYCVEALVTSLFPTSPRGAATQRSRWEGGHVAMMQLAIRRLFDRKAWRNPAYVALLMDVMVPPLTLLIFILTAMLVIGVGLALAGVAVWPLAISIANLLLLLAATACAWIVHGKDIVPARALAGLPFYVARKLVFYPRALFSGAPTSWIRTDRNKPAAP